MRGNYIEKGDQIKKWQYGRKNYIGKELYREKKLDQKRITPRKGAEWGKNYTKKSDKEEKDLKKDKKQNWYI